MSARVDRAAMRRAFAGDGDERDRCVCGHARAAHLSRECVGCSDSSGCRGFEPRAPIDRAAIFARIAKDLESIEDFDLERLEYQIGRRVGRPVTHPEQPGRARLS